MIHILQEYYLAKTKKSNIIHVVIYDNKRKSICGEEFYRYSNSSGIRLLDKYVSEKEAEECLCEECEKILNSKNETAHCWALQIFETV
jgi:CTP:phosphocholine cytidylyltransferase-like protein